MCLPISDLAEAALLINEAVSFPLLAVFEKTSDGKHENGIGSFKKDEMLAKRAV